VKPALEAKPAHPPTPPGGGTKDGSSGGTATANPSNEPKKDGLQSATPAQQVPPTLVQTAAAAPAVIKSAAPTVVPPAAAPTVSSAAAPAVPPAAAPAVPPTATQSTTPATAQAVPSAIAPAVPQSATPAKSKDAAKKAEAPSTASLTPKADAPATPTSKTEAPPQPPPLPAATVAEQSLKIAGLAALSPKVADPATLDPKVADPVAPVPKAAVAAPAASTHKDDTPKSDLQKIIESGVLRVGMCAIDQKPFHVKGEDGRFSGFDVDLAHKLAKALGVSVVFVEGADWDALVDDLTTGKSDVVISNLSLTPERGAKILFSTPYAKIRQCLLLNKVLLARAQSQGRNTLSKIFDGTPMGDSVEAQEQTTQAQPEKKVANMVNTLQVQAGTACVDWGGQLFPKIPILTTASWDEILDNIKSRKIIGTISDELEIKQRMHDAQAIELVAFAIKDRYDFIVIGVNNKAHNFLSFINSVLISNNVVCNVEEEKE
jgi:ABC-type amino acid transport substrate-binding protein